jgi:Protein of unknown function (DUF3159)
VTDRPPAREAARVAGPQDLIALLGGTRGMVESTVPGVIFAVAYPLTGGRLGASLVAAVVAAVVIFAVALLQRRSVQQSIGGLVGVGVMAGYAAWRGDPTSYFLPSIIKNAAYAAAYLVSVVVRFPLLGVVLGPLLGEGFRWRQDPARMRAYTLASLVWVAMFALRVGVQWPLYAAGATTTLGLVNIPLGIPLFLPVCAATWLILRSTHPVRAEPEAEAAQLPAAAPTD